MVAAGALNARLKGVQTAVSMMIQCMYDTALTWRRRGRTAGDDGVGPRGAQLALLRHTLRVEVVLGAALGGAAAARARRARREAAAAAAAKRPHA